MEREKPQDIHNEQWNREKMERHQANLADFSGFYHGTYLDHGNPPVTREIYARRTEHTRTISK